MEFSLTQHEDDEEDDEIVNSNTPLPVSHKPKVILCLARGEAWGR